MNPQRTLRAARQRALYAAHLDEVKRQKSLLVFIIFLLLLAQQTGRDEEVPGTTPSQDDSGDGTEGSEPQPADYEDGGW